VFGSGHSPAKIVRRLHATFPIFAPADAQISRFTRIALCERACGTGLTLHRHRGTASAGRRGGSSRKRHVTAVPP